MLFLDFLSAASSQDSQKTLLHTEEVSTGEVSMQAGLLSYPVNLCEDPESDNGIKERHSLAEKQTIPNEAQRNEETTSTSSVSQGIEVQLTELNSDSLAESWSPPAVVPLGCIYRKEASAPLLNSELVAAAKSNSVLSKLEEKQTSNTEKQRPLEKIPGNNDTDRSEESRSTSVVLQEDKAYLTKVNSHGSVKKIESRSSPTDVSARCMYAEEDSSPFLLPGSVTSVKSFSISSKLEENQNSNTEKQGPLEKTPSNVRKMISAFESSLPQDSKSHIKPPITKSQSYQNGMESPLQNEHLKEAETENTEPLQSNSGRVVDTTTVGDLQQAPVYIRKKKLLVGFYRDLDKMKSYQDNERLKESSEPHIQSKIMSSSAKNNHKVEHKEVDTREERSLEDSIKTSTIEIPSVSGQVSDDNFIIRNSCNLFMNQQDSGGTSIILGREKEIHSIDSHAINIRSALHDRLQSVLCSEDEHNFFKTSGTWIFPDEAISSCITTCGKQAMDLIGGCSFEAKTHQGRISSSEHAKEHSMSSGTDLTLNNDVNTSLKPRNPKLESAADSETSGRLVGQVIKVAIMFGFGTLVLLTRQMKNR